MVKIMNEQDKSRFLTPFQVFSLSFGSAVGWGAFAMPGTTFLKKAGPLGTFAAMQIALLIMLLITYNYFYLIRKHPVNGGQYVYTKLAFGRTHGFVCAWFIMLSYFLIVPLNATAIFLIVRTIFGDALQRGFHYVLAGYDIYGGEVLVSVLLLVFFALFTLRGLHASAKLQSVLAFCFLFAIVVLLLGGIVSGRASVANFTPHFYPGGHAGIQIMAVAATGPWAFIGFESVPQYAANYKFRLEKIKPIMDLAVIVSGLVYILLTLFAASVVPEGYPDWVAYINDLPALSGAAGLPTYYYAFTVLGHAGTIAFIIAAFCAITTGVLGSYLATAQLFYLLAQDGMFPAVFQKKNRANVPHVAMLFIMMIAVIGPFFGRVFLNWVIDSSSIGASIGFGYTSLAARKAARADGNRDMVVLGTIGAFFSLLFALILLVPIPAINASLGRESYICLLVWSTLGLLVYVAMHKRRGEKDAL